MLPDRAIPLNSGEFARLNAFLHSSACGRDAMRVSRARGFLTAAGSGPDTLESAEWLRLAFDEPVFPNSESAQDMLGLALRLYGDIEQSLGEAGRYRRLCERDGQTAGRSDATASQGLVSGMSVCRDRRAAHAQGVLNEPLRLIFRLSQKTTRTDADYVQWCEVPPIAAEVVYRYWRADRHVVA